MSVVKNINKFKSFITKNGVGSNDVVSDSVRSYLTYIKQTAKHTQIEINSDSLNSSSDIDDFVQELKLSGKVSKKTITNYTSAMKQYVKMVNS